MCLSASSQPPPPGGLAASAGSFQTLRPPWERAWGSPQEPAPDVRQHPDTISKTTQRCPAPLTCADAGASVNPCCFKPVSFGVAFITALSDTDGESQCWPWGGEIDSPTKNQQEGTLLNLCISVEVTKR